MAPIVIDLISSSPCPSKGASPASSPQPQQLQAASSVPSVAGLDHESDTRTKSSANEAVINLTTQKRSSMGTGIELNWSDFDDIDDSAFDLLDEPQPKRRKIPGPQAGLKAPFDLSASHRSVSVPKLPPLTYNQRPPPKRRELEPITFTSSLGETQPKSRSRTPSPSSKHCESAQKAIQVEHDEPFLSDPFETPRQPVKQSTARRAVSFDPFMSSSPTQSSKAQDRANTTKPCRPGLAKRPDAQPKQRCESDPFTDSPPSPERATGTDDVLICIDDSSEASSKSSDEDLPSIMDMDLTKRRARSPMRRTQSDTTWSNQKAPKKTRAPKKTTNTRPKQTAAEREAEKQNKRREREQLKAEKMVEKHRLAALAEVNKLRTDKKVSTPEMIVDLPSGLDAGLQIQIAQMLQGLGVEHTTWSCPNHSMIKWRRKVISKFNQDLGRWEPIPQRIAQEEIALVIFVAEEFVSLALQGALPERVAEIQRQNGRKKLIFLLQGLTAWSRKNRSIRNRKFTSGVRAADDDVSAAAAAASSSRPSKARAAAAAEYVSEDIIEDAMLSLQVEHGILLHHTAVTIDTAKWVINFTQHISTIPYRKQRDQATSVAGFCMESGQVRTGDDAQSTYLRMLQEIVRITGPIAHGVAGVFKTVTELVHGLEEGGPETLAEVKKVANKDGALTDRNVGQAVSRRVHKIFTSTDENSTDV
ncbi:hypothetical protein E4U17_004645 [Claviceps sp. LM77 group G4]|nr:hypothetical protein E4U17_004645 [Claviceps sp. LM77 group G4]KAG6066732.1 hypothetical protein E4U33_005509 [Claviceps sp. LM78 group G4]KAG6075642.1 hypothetical protein E4U16_003261 [Claviceps sp. LM84 group G4]